MKSCERWEQRPFALVTYLDAPQIHPVPSASQSPAFRKLLGVAARHPFPPHHISRLIDAKGRHEVALSESFPFAISLYRYVEGDITMRPSWHRRLELLLPLDGVMKERMGDVVVDVGPGDILVVDNLKPHGIAHDRGLNTRAIVISFLPECVFTAGAPPVDSVFLTPFQPPSRGRFKRLSSTAAHAAEAHEAVARLLEWHFSLDELHRQAGCKAWLLVLLHVLARAFRSDPQEHSILVRSRACLPRVQPVLDHLEKHPDERVSAGQAARLCQASTATFARNFKQATGLTLGAYMHRIRMTRALELLETTDALIADIAVTLGFSDQSHFNRHFRRAFGHTPSAHRAQLTPPLLRKPPRG